MLVGEILEKSAWAYPGKEAFVGDGLRLTFSETNERVNRLANSLMCIGIRKGDRVAILGKNSVQYMELYFAIARVGGITVPVNWRLRAEELSGILQDACPVVFFYGNEFSSVVDSLNAELGAVRHKILLDGRADGAASVEELIRRGSPQRPPVELSPDDLAIQFYTGGTTARPKGVLWSHRTVHYHCLHLCLGWNFSPEVVMLVILPIFHQTGAHTMGNVFMGATSVILPEFDVLKLLQTIERERVTHAIMVPTTIVMLIEHPEREKYDLSSLKYIQYGGAPMPVKPLEKAMNLLNCSFSQCYGMTEAPLLTRLSPQDHVVGDSEIKLRRLHSVGRPMPDVLGIRIVDDNDNELPTGTVGEIIARLPSQMLGYWNLPAESASALRGGWVHTGDMGYFDESGYLFLTERKKDIIISGGENISAKEVEEILYEHPAVLEAAVIGVPHDLWGEAVKGIVAVKEGMKVTERELVQHCRARLAGYKCPKSVDMVDCLPKSAVGKILKRELREKYRGGEGCGPVREQRSGSGM